MFVVVQGVILGLTYGLLALGLVLIYKSNRVLNFAHGELGVLSAVVLHKLVADFHTPYWPTLLAVLVMAVGIGAGCELLLRRLFSQPRLLVMVATIGLAQLLFVFTLLGFLQTKHPAGTFPLPFTLTAHVGVLVLRSSDFLTLMVAPAVALGLGVFFSVTPYGLAMRAAAENAESARLGGIWVKRTSTVAWMMAGLLSAVTAILVAPTRPPLGFAQALGPGLLVRALAAALLAAMIDLRVAFVAGIGVGVIEEIVTYNNVALVEPVMYGLLMVALLLRVRTLRVTSRTEERSSWQLGALTKATLATVERRTVGRFATALAIAVALGLPLMVGNSQDYLFSLIFCYGVIALSITILSGWAGQLSLGHFGLVAIGALVMARWGGQLNLFAVMAVAGLITAAVAVVIGVPALRIRGLYLAVTTLGFAVLVSGWLLSDRRLGLPNAMSTHIVRPSILGIRLAPQRSFYYFALIVLAVAVVLCTNLRRSGVGRALIAVRDNETTAAALGIRVVITKLTAFALSGFLAGIAGVLFAMAQERIGVASFDPFVSILIVAMVVIGGMGSIRGAIFGAVYLLGIPALFGTTSSTALQQTVQLLTGGVGLLIFVLYLPGGLAAMADRLADGLARQLELAQPALEQVQMQGAAS